MKLYVLHGSHEIAVVVASSEAEAQTAAAPGWFGYVRHVQEYDLFKLAIAREPQLIASYSE